MGDELVPWWLDEGAWLDEDVTGTFEVVAEEVEPALDIEIGLDEAFPADELEDGAAAELEGLTMSEDDVGFDSTPEELEDAFDAEL